MLSLGLLEKRANHLEFPEVNKRKFLDKNADSLIFELQHSHENGSKWAQKPSSQRPKWLAILDVHHPPKERGFISLCCLESIDQLHPITEKSNHTPNLKYTRWSIIPSSWRMIISNILNSITPDNHRPPFLNHIYIDRSQLHLHLLMVKSPIKSCSASYGAHLDLFPMLRICGFHFELHDIDELVDVARRLATRLARSERSDESIQGKKYQTGTQQKERVFWFVYWFMLSILFDCVYYLICFSDFICSTKRAKLCFGHHPQI